MFGFAALGVNAFGAVASFVLATAAASGAGAASATGIGIKSVTASAAGTGSAAATGTGVKPATASAAAVGAATATGIAFFAGNGAAIGVGAAVAAATGFNAANASAAGVGAALATGTKVMGSAGLAAGAGAASAVSFYFQGTASVLKPDADNIDGGWLNELGSPSLAPSIDEAAPNDTDYIISSDRPVSDICKIGLGNPSGAIQQPLAVLYRFKKQGTAPINLRVRLLQGSTEIAAWTHSDISVNPVTVEQVLSGAQFAAITDPNDLFLELQASV